MRIRREILTVLFCFSSFASGCGTTPMKDQTSQPQIANEVIARVSTLRVAFGHQSVGRNILEGIEELLKDRPENGWIHIREATLPDIPQGPALIHFRIGRNGDPQSKIAAWIHAMNTGMGAQVDVALFKFCYEDVSPATDPEALFADYSRAIQELRGKFPATAFVPVTIPLTTIQGGPKALIKRLIGSPLSGYRENVGRERFNALVRERYDRDGVIFDLAGVESTRPNGGTSTFDVEGHPVRSLATEYSADGGHLNASGRRQAAIALLRTLSQIAAQPAHGASAATRPGS